MLRLKLGGEEQQRLTRRYTENTEAYQLYLKGRHYALKYTIDGTDKGIENFHQAIQLDPGYALATTWAMAALYTGLGDNFDQAFAWLQKLVTSALSYLLQSK